jgi:hypothetical protein
VVFLLIRIRSLAAPALPGSLLLQSTNDPREVFSGSSSAFLFWGGGSAGKPRPDAVDGGNYLLLFRAPLLPLILLALPVFLALISLVFFTHLKVKAWFFASWLPSSSRIPRKARRSVSCCRPLSLPWLLQRRFFSSSCHRRLSCHPKFAVSISFRDFSSQHFPPLLVAPLRRCVMYTPFDLPLPLRTPHFFR